MRESTFMKERGLLYSPVYIFVKKKGLIKNLRGWHDNFECGLSLNI
jgi:hypothetical protein